MTNTKRSKLTLAERALAAVTGWRAECARQDHATHLVNSYSVTRDAARDLPITLAECIEFGASAMRGHLAVVRRSPST